MPIRACRPSTTIPPGLDGRDKVARRARTVTIIILLLLAGLGRTLLARQANADTLAKQASQNAIQQVRVVQAQNNRHDNQLTLPATCRASARRWCMRAAAVTSNNGSKTSASR
jgi:hypothetical protein